MPSLDLFTPFLTANDDHFVITPRGIGEVEPNNPSSPVSLSGTLDEFNLPP